MNAYRGWLGKMTTHRADYIFDHGMWIGNCRVCDFSVADPVRRRAADQFRQHIKEMLDIDREQVIVEATAVTTGTIELELLAATPQSVSVSDLA